MPLPPRMDTTYTLAWDPMTKAPSNWVVVRDADQMHIPFDPENIDYQAYQAWLAAGNTPNPPAQLNPGQAPGGGLTGV